MKNLLYALFFLTIPAFSQEKLDYMDVFQLEWISDPQISADGQKIVYVRHYNDVMTDQTFSNVWLINFDGSNNRPLTTGSQKDSAPRWSPDGKKILYKSGKDGTTQLYLRWLDDGSETRLTNLKKSIGNATWSPDGQWIAFNSFVDEKAAAPVSLPSPPDGAKWAAAPKYIDDMNYRQDGAGYLKEGYSHLFVLSADGGTPRQLTSGKYNYGADYCWTPDGKSLLVSANRHEDADFEPANAEVYEIAVKDGAVKALTTRMGPDGSPVVSPDGKWIAYLGYDEAYQGYQVTNLYVMQRDGAAPRQLITTLDRDVENITWSRDGKGLYFQYDDKGNTWIAYTDLNGKVTNLADKLGGLTLDRPYGGGTFSVSDNGRFAFTYCTAEHPADLASGMKGSTEIKRLTRVNDDLFGQKKPGKVEEIWYTSTAGQEKVQGWILYPPDFDPMKKYPLVLEIHGGPFTNYGPRFAMELQLFAAKGYVVLYTNPRGSTSYGGRFGNLIHHNYPGQDYDDLMAGVDAVIGKKFIDTNNLFVTGGSGGGVLTAWIVGHTNRFRAAVVSKPVINWYSFVLYADGPAFFYRYWFPGLPWDNVAHYMERSPISYAKNVKTPTMLLTGEQDYRTPMAETEQYYAALKLNKVETAMVRIQEAGHGLTSKPSNQINKAGYILGWFEKYRKP